MRQKGLTVIFFLFFVGTIFANELWEGNAAAGTGSQFMSQGNYATSNILTVGSVAKVTNPLNGQTVSVTISDRLYDSRLLMLLSPEASSALGFSSGQSFRVSVIPASSRDNSRTGLEDYLYNPDPDIYPAVSADIGRNTNGSFLASVAEQETIEPLDPLDALIRQVIPQDVSDPIRTSSGLSAEETLIEEDLIEEVIEDIETDEEVTEEIPLGDDQVDTAIDESDPVEPTALIEPETQVEPLIDSLQEPPEVIAEEIPEVIAEEPPEVIAEEPPEVIAEEPPEVIAEEPPEVIAEEDSREPTFSLPDFPELLEENPLDEFTQGLELRDPEKLLFLFPHEDSSYLLDETPDFVSPQNENPSQPSALNVTDLPEVEEESPEVHQLESPPNEDTFEALDLPSIDREIPEDFERLEAPAEEDGYTLDLPSIDREIPETFERQEAPVEEDDYPLDLPSIDNERPEAFERLDAPAEEDDYPLDLPSIDNERPEAFERLDAPAEEDDYALDLPSSENELPQVFEKEETPEEEDEYVLDLPSIDNERPEAFERQEAPTEEDDYPLDLPSYENDIPQVYDTETAVVSGEISVEDLPLLESEGIFLDASTGMIQPEAESMDGISLLLPPIYRIDESVTIGLEETGLRPPQRENDEEIIPQDLPEIEAEEVAAVEEVEGKPEQEESVAEELPEGESEDVPDVVVSEPEVVLEEFIQTPHEYEVTTLLPGAGYIQLAAFSLKEALDRAILTIPEYYPITVSPVVTRGNLYYRLLIGPLLPDEKGLVLRQFKSRGFSGAYLLP